MSIEKADRLKKLPPYLFAQIDQAKNKAKEEGRDIINLGIGDPDQPTPAHIVDKLYAAAQDSANQHYALDFGMRQLRETIASWFERRFSVRLDPNREILPLIGSKEGLAHLPLALLNPGDTALIPEPSYPPYRSATIFAGGTPHDLPLLSDNDFYPRLDKIGRRTLARSKLLFLNYPNNPTAQVAEQSFFTQAVDFARKHKILIAHDAAYSEITYDNLQAPSILQTEGAKELAVEFHSFSKTYNMTGWRIGWVCGNADIIAALSQVKANVDSGIFQAIQLAGVAALNTAPEHLQTLNSMYQERRDALCDGLNSLGWQVSRPKATFYIWTRLPKNHADSIKFAQLLLDQADVVATPGVGFGPSGEGYIRFALTVSKERLQEAITRIGKVI